MTTALDTRIAAVALRLIDEKGTTATFIESGTGPVYDPISNNVVTGSKTTRTAKVSPPAAYDTAAVDGQSVLSSDVRVLLAASGLTWKPVVGMEVNVGGDSWRAVSVSSIYSGDDIAVYRIQLRTS